MNTIRNNTPRMPYKDFTPSQKAGQRLMVGFEGTRFGPELKHLISTLKVGGIILFAENIADPEQVRNLCTAAQQCAASCGQPPLFIAVDQEGGKVARLRPPFTEFPGNPHMKTRRDAVHFADVTARELSSVGFNMNMAPVLDVALPGPEGVMKDRSFGDDPIRVTELGMAVIRGLQAGGVMAVAKHFPGIGRTRLDSHLDLPFLEATPRQLEACDMPPFEAAIREGTAGIMLSHICYRRLDEVWPASLSRKICAELLRKKMGYRGVVMTDDLDMGAVAAHFDTPTTVHRVLQAEVDIALICHKGPAIETAFEEILRIHEDNPDLAAKGMDALTRIMKLKDLYLR
ncbi:MAG: beta-N-acetylhexosaminidase [Deltaproteobacteria bacterium]|nr:beta-N-acetylhexosaminidase [Deltaproteobacteria bacterium]